MNNDFDSIKESIQQALTNSKDLGLDLTQGTDNLIGDTKIGISTQNSPELNGGLNISMDVEPIKLTATKMEYHMHIPEDALSILLDESGENLVKTIINPKFVEEYKKALELFESVKSELDNAKAMMLKFIEDNHTGSIKSNGMTIKYTSATTTTAIDSKALKAEFPDIAAKFSKVSARKSSISVEVK